MMRIAHEGSRLAAHYPVGFTRDQRPTKWIRSETAPTGQDTRLYVVNHDCVLSVSFRVEEKEEFILPDRAANSAAKLLAIKRNSGRLRSWHEPVARVQPAYAWATRKPRI